MFFFADRYFQQLTLFRQIWIKGRVRGGKSLLGFATADELIKRGICEGGISNIPNALPLHPWAEIVPDARGGEHERLIRDCVVVYDEPWVQLDNRTSLTNDRTYGAFVGKLRCIILYPSVIPIDKRNSYLQAQPLTRIRVPIIGMLVELLLWIARVLTEWRYTSWLGKGMGAILKPIAWLAEDIRIYKWIVEMGEQRDEGLFILAQSSKYYDLYDTAYMPLDDGDIGHLWRRTIAQEQNLDVQAGRWWVTADEYELLIAQMEAQRIGENNADIGVYEGTGKEWEWKETTTGKQQEQSGREANEGEPGEHGQAGISTGTDLDYSPEIRTIAQPFYGRPEAHYSDESDY